MRSTIGTDPTPVQKFSTHKNVKIIFETSINKVIKRNEVRLVFEHQIELKWQNNNL